MNLEQETENLRKLLSTIDIWLAHDATLEEIKEVVQKYYLPTENGGNINE